MAYNYYSPHPSSITVDPLAPEQLDQLDPAIWATVSAATNTWIVKELEEDIIKAKKDARVTKQKLEAVTGLLKRTLAVLEKQSDAGLRTSTALAKQIHDDWKTDFEIIDAGEW